MIVRRLLLIACALMLFAGRAHAQVGTQSDVTGPPVTSGEIVGGMFVPTGPTSAGATDFLRAPAAGAYASAALRLESQLRAGALTAFKDASTTIRIPESTQRTLLKLVQGVDCRGSEDSLVYAITRNGNLADAFSATPELIARRLAHSLCNLTSRAANIDPTHVNSGPAAQIQEAVAAFNAVIDNSNEAFLADPPPEILAIRSALGTIVSDTWNATPAPAPPRTPPPPPAPVTERINVCVVDPSVNGGLRSVDALRNRTTGDTTVVSNGSTVSLSSTLPRVPVMSDAVWFESGRPLEIGTTADKIQYTATGGARVISAANLEFLGTVNGLPVYTDRSVIGPIEGLNPGTDLSTIVDERPAVRRAIEERIPVVYVPLKPTGCVFQPMQMLEQVRKNRE
jgi:hypothetical protein